MIQIYFKVIKRKVRFKNKFKIKKELKFDVKETNIRNGTEKILEGVDNE